MVWTDPREFPRRSFPVLRYGSPNGRAVLVVSEYAAIVAADRSNLQRAMKIGAMLIHMKSRVGKHGQWRMWLNEHCPTLNYETAKLYMRLAKNSARLEQIAAEKSVTVTDLTIREARQLLANPKPKRAKQSRRKAEPATEPEPTTVTIESLIANMGPDEVFNALQDEYDKDQLQTLVKLITNFLRRQQNQQYRQQDAHVAELKNKYGANLQVMASFISAVKGIREIRLTADIAMKRITPAVDIVDFASFPDLFNALKAEAVAASNEYWLH